MVYKRDFINLGGLLLDLENARHGDLDDQNAILKWMSTETKKSKLVKLAQSIAEHGPSPIEFPMVIPAGAEHHHLYVVVEGNRRVAAIKMLLDPDKCPDERMRKKIKQFKASAKVPIPTVLECVVVPEFDIAAPWIKLRHGGEHEGAGIINWGAKEYDYFSKRIDRKGPNDASMRLLDYAVKEGLITQEFSNKIPITNVTRVINSPDVRRQIGLHQKKGELSRVCDKAYFNKAIGDMLLALGCDDWTVSKLKSKDQREHFIKQVKEDGGWGQYQVEDESPLVPTVNKGGTSSAEINQTGKRSSPDPLARSNPIPRDVHLKINNKKLRTIFKELKDIEVKPFKSASAVLTRVFMEVCLDQYIDKNNLTTELHKNKKNPKKPPTLSNKATVVKKHLLANHIDSIPNIKNDLKGLEVFCGNKHNIGSVDSFNAVVHNPNFLMSPEEIKINWDRLAPCLQWFEGHI